MLFVVFFLVDDDVSVDEDVVEEKELSRFGFLSAHFCQDSFADQYSARHTQRLQNKSDK